jgi:hypothetical protein
MLTPFKFGVGGRLGSGRQWMPWIELSDHVRAVEWVLTHEELCGPVNLAAPGAVTNRDFTKALGQHLHRPTLFPVPAFVLRLVFGQLGKELLLFSQRVTGRCMLCAVRGDASYERGDALVLMKIGSGMSRAASSATSMCSEHRESALTQAFDRAPVDNDGSMRLCYHIEVRGARASGGSLP